MITKTTEYQYNTKSFDCFGARCCASDLSVDSMASRYPNESPYCYAGLNPVMITDPNGMWKDEGGGKWSESDNFLASFTYGIVDDIWVYAISLIYGPEKARHLTGAGANRNKLKNNVLRINFI